MSFNASKIFDYLHIAGKLAMKRRDGKSFYHAAIGIRNDGTLISAVNGFASCPSLCNRLSHAESRLARKLDKGAIVIVARVRKGDGKMSISKPCPSCERILRSKKVRKVFYSINENEYGVMTF